MYSISAWKLSKLYSTNSKVCKLSLCKFPLHYIRGVHCTVDSSLITLASGHSITQHLSLLSFKTGVHCVHMASKPLYLKAPGILWVGPSSWLHTVSVKPPWRGSERPPFYSTPPICPRGETRGAAVRWDLPLYGAIHGREDWRVYCITPKPSRTDFVATVSATTGMSINVTENTNVTK